MYAKSRRKKIWIPITALLLTAALGVGIWFGTRGSGEPVNVYPFQYIGMTEFWGDAQESYGPVTTDKIQTEFLSDTQTVTEVKVKDGDAVKKGDILFSFDTTLDALTLERKRLEVEKIKVQIKAAEERLQDTREMVPYEPPKPTEPKEEDLGDELKDQLFKISENAVYDGKTKETALICWLKDGTSISDAILQELYETSLKYREKNAEKQDDTDTEKSNASVMPETVTEPQNPADHSGELEEQKYEVEGFFSCNGETVKPDTILVGKDGYLIKDTYTHEGKTYWLESATPVNPNAVLKDLTIEAYPQGDREKQDAWVELWGDGVKVKYMRSVSVEGGQLKDHAFTALEKDKTLRLEMNQDAVLMFRSQMEKPPKGTELAFSVTPANDILSIAYNGDHVILSGKPGKLTTQPVNYTVTARYTFEDNHGDNRAVEETFSFSVTVVPPEEVKEGEFYVVFKTTEKNFLKGTPIVWHGAKVTVFEDGRFDVTPYDAFDFADHTLPVEEEIEIDLPEINPDEMYTAEQILDMQKQCYAIIKEQTEKLKLAENEYAVMQRELGDGNVYAEIEGKVVSLLTEEEARQQKQPLMKVSGGGGFYIEGSVSELEKDKLKLGQEVTVNDWNSGGIYMGEVVSIGDFPLDNDNWNGMGNPTVSYYPFKAFVGEDADLQAGSYVSMSYSTASGEQGIYLEKAFVRTEKGGSYIFVRGADGKLEKRNVQVGKVLWGSYYEILSSSLGEEDCLAFPYGKHVKPGAPTVESDLSTLYSF